ncbi:hypothetical protein HBA_0440 [Sodalis endosymbiont of Henestaris halophilus]|nr:hypothetical protein HBA_0440 [Sodalis endosymbiont of Henestaris halophilus]
MILLRPHLHVIAKIVYSLYMYILRDHEEGLTYRCHYKLIDSTLDKEVMARVDVLLITDNL